MTHIDSQSQCTRPIIVLVGHGSRTAAGSSEPTAFAESYQKSRPDLDVKLGFIELSEPNIRDVLEETMATATQVTLVPLSLLTAGHVKNELPLLVTSLNNKYPHCRTHITPALGIAPKLISAVVEQVSSLSECTNDTVFIIVGRGSSDPDANGDFYKIARLIGEGLGSHRTIPCFVGITGPTLADALELAARQRPKSIVVIPYFLFSGVLLERIEERCKEFRLAQPWIQIDVAPALAGSHALVEAVSERVADALNGGSPLPCTTCQYRTPIGKIVDKVGGLAALLWSARHSFTHAQASAHTHSHKPISKHIMVCTNTECADRGSLTLVTALRRLIKDRGANKKWKVTRTYCMGRCGEGPTMVVYPDGIWYRGVTADDAPDIVNEHLAADRLVSRRVDHIM